MIIGTQTTPSIYCKRLAVYMTDIGGIRACCLREFGEAPPREAIEQMRAEHLAKAEKEAGKYDRAYLNCIGPEARKREGRRAA